MAELQPVPRARSSLAGREGTIAAVLGIALLLAIAKPWGSETGIEPVPFGSPTPSAPAGSMATGQDPAFDASLFGPFEPTPEWSIWQAGYFVSIMYVARAPRPLASPSATPSVGRPGASAPPSIAPAPGSAWPSTITVGPNDHHLWLGIDTPLGWSLDSAILRRIDLDGLSRVVPTRRIPSPWANHFTILAMASADPGTSLAVWPAGDYRLDLRVSPGDIRRTLEIRIETTTALESRAPDQR